MTPQDEIIELAKQAGWQYAHGESGFEPLWEFAKLVDAKATAKEREACAKVCDDIRHPWGYSSETSDWSRGTEHCADAIRARGNKE